MTTEQSVIGGRETFGEPKKIGAGRRSSATATTILGTVTRLGTTFVEIDGHGRGAPVERRPTRTRTDFYFKFLPAPDGKGFDAEPSLVYCHRDETTRSSSAVEGEVHPARVALRPGRRPARSAGWSSITLAERRSIQRGEIVGRVPGRVARALRPPALRRPVARSARTDGRAVDEPSRSWSPAGPAASAGPWPSGSRAEGMRVVLADVEAPVLDATVAELRAEASTSVGVAHRRLRLRLGRGPARPAPSTFGAVHVLCNNAGVGAGAEGHMWEHELNDWRLGARRQRVGRHPRHQGLRARMLEPRRARPRGQHLVGQRRRLAAAGTPDLRARPRRRVGHLTESLYAQLRWSRPGVGASVLFPGPHMLRTGLFDVVAQPAELVRTPDATRGPPPSTLETYEQRMADAGSRARLHAGRGGGGRVVDAIRDRPVLDPAPSERTDEQIQARADSMLERAEPDLPPRRDRMRPDMSRSDLPPSDTATWSSRPTATPACPTSSTATGSIPSTATRSTSAWPTGPA